MKELSIEQKAKAYDEAIEKAKNCLKDGTITTTAINYIETVFPELVESEGERIRKEIVRFIRMEVEDEIVGNKWIAWLEKQSNKSVNIDIESLVSSYEQRLKSQFNGVRNNPLVNMCLTAFRHGVENVLEELNLKQGEQKPADKAEPKFKVGDVMRTLQEAANGMNGGMPVVVSIDNEYYHCTNELIAIKDQDDYEYPPMNRATAWLEKQGENDSNKMSIWKHWKDGIAGNGEGKPIYLVKVGNTYSLNSCLGFECDYIELSELDNLMLEKQGDKKKPAEWSLPYEKNETAGKLIALAECLEMDGDCLFNGLSGNDYGKFLRELAKKIEQKSDDKIEALRTEYEKGRADAIAEMKSSWSEEDEKMCKNILECLRNGWKKLPTDILWYESWLKSLKSQSHWKPTKEQMYMLEWLTTNVLDNGVVGNKAKEVLNTLIEQLKSL